MGPLLTLQDADIFPDAGRTEDFSAFNRRVAVKVALCDRENMIALVGTKYRLLPGGGVESNETLEQAVIRECLEEVGCSVDNIKEIATALEYRAKTRRHQTTHFFTATLRGEKGVPETSQVDEQGIQVEWFTQNEAIALLEKQLKETLIQP